MTPPRAANKEASSNRGNNPANNSGTQTTSPKNVIPKEERTRSRTGKNRTRVESGEHHKVLNLQPWHSGVGAVELHFIFRSIWRRKHGKRRLERPLH